MYLLFKAIRDGRDVVYEDASSSIHIVYTSKGSCRAYYGKAHYGSAPELRNRSTLHIHDSCSRGLPSEPYSRMGAKTVVLSTPNELNYKTLMRQGAMVLTIPSYDAQELQHRRKYFPEVDDASFEEKLALCGGASIRLALCESVWRTEVLLLDAIHKTSLCDLSKLSDPNRPVYYVRTGSGSLPLLKTTLPGGADLTSIETCRPSKVPWEFCSEYVVRIALNKVERAYEKLKIFHSGMSSNVNASTCDYTFISDCASTVTTQLPVGGKKAGHSMSVGAKCDAAGMQTVGLKKSSVDMKPVIKPVGVVKWTSWTMAMKILR